MDGSSGRSRSTEDERKHGGVRRFLSKITGRRRDSKKETNQATVTPRPPKRRQKSGSSTRNALATSWNAIHLALKTAERCLDGTPAKAVVGLLGALADIKKQFDDNDDSFNSLYTNTVDLLQVVEVALKADVPDPNKEIDAFYLRLHQEISVLEELSNRWLLTKVVNVEDDKATLAQCLQDIDSAATRLNIHLVLVNTTKIHAIHENIKHENVKKLCRARKAIYNADLGENVSLPRSPCTEGTRVPILTSIIDWANDITAGSPSVCWLTGPAGTGKTTIAYTIASYFDKVHARVESRSKVVLGGNFLCSRQFEETRRRVNILPTLAYQLACKSRSFSDAIHGGEHIETLDTFQQQMSELIVEPLKNLSKDSAEDQPLCFLFVIDALDELNASEGQAFLKDFLNALHSNALQNPSPRLKVFITSRSDPKISSEMEKRQKINSFPVFRLQDIPQADVQSDIRAYLRANLIDLVGEPELEELTKFAGGLFIIATTVVRYLEGGVSASDQLHLLRPLLSSRSLSLPDAEQLDGQLDPEPLLVDGVYQYILKDAFSKLRSSHVRIMHTAICTFERTSTLTIADLLPDCDEETVASVLSRLHAVFYVKDGQVLWYHASFPDFILDKSRSNFTIDGRPFDMSCDLLRHHILLAQSCLRVMDAKLHFNMTEISTSYLLDSEQPGLVERINDKITPSLRYACRYWATHLNRARPSEKSSTRRDETLRTFQDLCPTIEGFLHLKCLFWIEAMNLTGLSRKCPFILEVARDSMKEANKVLAKQLDSISRFARDFSHSGAALSTPHLYLSALATSDQDSAWIQTWRSHFVRLPQITQSKPTEPLKTLKTPGLVHSVAVPADGGRVASGLEDGTVRVWQSASGHNSHTLRGHTERVLSVAFSRDGKWIASGSKDTTIRVWNALSGQQTATLNGHTDRVTSASFSGDGKLIASGSSDTLVKVWDMSSGQELQTCAGHTETVNSVALSKNGKQVVSGSVDGSVRVWDALAGNELAKLDGHSERVNSVAVSDDGKWIVSGSGDKTVRLWDATSFQEIKKFTGHLDWIHSVALSYDCEWIASCSNDISVRVWHVSSGRAMQVLDGHTNSVRSVAFSNDGRIFSGGSDRSILIWDVPVQQESPPSFAHRNPVRSVAFSSKGGYIASASSDKSVGVWDASSGRQLCVFRGHDNWVNSVAFTVDGRQVLSGGGDRVVKLWDALSGNEVRTFFGHTDWVNSIAISSDGKWAVSASEDGTLRLWDVSTGQELRVFSGHTKAAVRCVAFTGNNERIISGSKDAVMMVWDASTGEILQVLDGHSDMVNSVACSNNGKWIASGSADGSVRLWDLPTYQPVHTLSIPRGVNSVAFSKDSTQLASGANDRSIIIWDTFSGQQLQILLGHIKPVKSIAFSENWLLVSGSADTSFGYGTWPSEDSE